MVLGDRTRSESGLDPTQYQVLLIMEERMNEKLEKQNDKMIKEIRSVVEPLKDQLTGMEKRIDKRFDEGNARFSEHEDRMSEHSDHIEANSAAIREAHRILAEKNKGGSEALTRKDKKQSVLMKIVSSVGLPLLIAALSPLVAIWVMIQLKMIAAVDPTPAPVMQPAKP